MAIDSKVEASKDEVLVDNTSKVSPSIDNLVAELDITNKTLMR